MGEPTRILFRADAGLEIGTGHVMRCLTLAEALVSQGEVEAIFVTREHRGNVIPEIIARGHRVITMPGNTGQPYGDHPAPPTHASWLEADWKVDAAATRAALEDVGAAWLVMDHYALDAAWEEEALRPGVSLLVLDDLADRSHAAEVLLDQNAGRVTEDYADLVPLTCDLRIGPTHALLRPEFVRLRPEALARRKNLTRPQTLLVTLGGIDKDNVVTCVLDALALAPAAQDLRITVVMGASAPHLSTVRCRATTMPMPVEVVASVSDMGARMLKADLCIGAAGSTAWERCALGLPTLQLEMAENQVSAARAMAAQGLSWALPMSDAPDFVEAVAAGLEQLSDMGHYRDMARAAAALTEGYGACRLATWMLERVQRTDKAHAH